MRKNYSEQITFRTTGEIFNAVESLAKKQGRSKTDVINELLGLALGTHSPEQQEDAYTQLEKRLNSRIDEQMSAMKQELELAIKK